MLSDSKFHSLVDILDNSPKYYSIIKIFEQIYTFLSNDKKWLKTFVMKNSIDFDFTAYERWRSHKSDTKLKYDDTRAPTRWVHLLQDMLFDIIKSLQLLSIFEV